MDLTNTRQWKDEPMVDYINKWHSLSLNCKERASEILAVEMCMQGMHWGLLYILQGNRPANFKELATRAHDMEISIANHGSNSPVLPDPYKERREKKKVEQSSRTTGKESLAEIIELSGSKRPEESGRVNEVLPYAFTLGEKGSNNVPEYRALIIGLQMALELRIPSLTISGNSKLVINQLLKEYEVKKEDLVPYFRYATILINKFDSVELEHVPRKIAWQMLWLT
ncbi:hypothetical protein RJ639_025339 [Escallonia herrerae]|uniref:RNase H type-1 domain-containing protein n=1 Tax=Escallonia herrerae TaxID=1293975 RepID=A0AA88UY50_9ASTE|nr:hypothetical protein RJ639_025339 [Escallonia herrerae]